MMSISEKTLNAWSSPGPQVTVQNTHKMIRSALAEYSWPPDVRYNDYLQGSYRNSTNIRITSDVDIVLECYSNMREDVSLIDLPERLKERIISKNAERTLNRFRKDTLKALRQKYGRAVSEGSKTVKIKPDKSSRRVGADVLPCLSFRSHFRNPAESCNDSFSGICFTTRTMFSETWTVNYPKAHYSMSSRKNSNDRTCGNFRSTVRMFKRAREAYNSESFIQLKTPSYFIECLLYSVPDELYLGTCRERYAGVIYWLKLQLENDRCNFICPNQQRMLFGDESDQWDLSEARKFVKAMESVWRNRK